jgi:hypothetical protein
VAFNQPLALDAMTRDRDAHDRPIAGGMSAREPGEPISSGIATGQARRLGASLVLGHGCS